jgi:hypothetical protein
VKVSEIRQIYWKTKAKALVLPVTPLRLFSNE